ncbi:unnamed protein product [Phaedon cochleariae]|uniref:U6 snRNA-associated Sm-like protein LSm7 n=1 Tax=Phaedon cochleariae TaxID=80249 RepID=A0A9P0DUG8_PHACE|nr:unnamed protein product [Phaedon cochleariae]
MVHVKNIKISCRIPIISMASSGDKRDKNQSGDQKEKKRKESILDLSKYLEKPIRVKFAGGREASGILKGYDPLLNLVLDSTSEYLRDSDDPYKLTEDTRELGLVVCRGTSVVLICPMDGTLCPSSITTLVFWSRG